MVELNEGISRANEYRHIQTAHKTHFVHLRVLAMTAMGSEELYGFLSAYLLYCFEILFIPLTTLTTLNI